LLISKHPLDEVMLPYAFVFSIIVCLKLYNDSFNPGIKLNFNLVTLVVQFQNIQGFSSLEVIEHSRRIFSVMKSKTFKVKHKAAEILIEIVIIVFAISLSFLLKR